MVKRSKRSVFSRSKFSCVKKNPYCSEIGCGYFSIPGKKKCSSCSVGIPPRDGLKYLALAKRFKQGVERRVKSVTISDEAFAKLLEGTGGELIAILKNVAKMERSMSPLRAAKLKFRASQVQPLMQGYGDCSAFNLPCQKEETINLYDKILGRVVDFWNLGLSDFCPTIRCYWGNYGDYRHPLKFYEDREKIFLGLLKPLLYCARKGNEEIEVLRKLDVVITINKIKNE